MKNSIEQDFNNSDHAKKAADSIITRMIGSKCYAIASKKDFDVDELRKQWPEFHGWYYGDECNVFCTQVLLNAFLMLALAYKIKD